MDIVKDLIQFIQNLFKNKNQLNNHADNENIITVDENEVWAELKPVINEEEIVEKEIKIENYVEPEIIKEDKMKLDALKGIIPDVVLKEIPSVMEKFNINTPLRLAHFLAQCAHESANWRAKIENLNYSEQGLLAVFGKYFNSTTAKEYARKPEKIANKVYANRMGNGNEASGDGWKYRGRGYIQLTGKTNYTKFGNSIGIDTVKHPELVSNEYPLLSAAWFFSSNNLNNLADKGFSDSDVTAVTRRVNGGTNGLADRISKFNQYYNLLK